jgi:hypothetical protein
MKEKTKNHPYCRVLYKTDNTPGWYVAYLNGTEQQVIEKCEKKSWAEYKIDFVNSRSKKEKEEYHAVLTACYVRMLSSWMYSSELDKWFIGEKIPNPQKPTYTATKFEVNYVINDESYDIAELKSYYMESKASYCGNERVEICNTLTISTEKEKYSLEFLYSDYECKKWFESFLQDIEEDRFTYFTVEEYWYTDIILWPEGEQCRIIVQDYTSHKETGVVDRLNFLVDKKKALKTFTNFFTKLRTEYKDLESKVFAMLTDEDKEYLKNYPKNI